MTEADAEMLADSDRDSVRVAETEREIVRDADVDADSERDVDNDRDSDLLSDREAVDDAVSDEVTERERVDDGDCDADSDKERPAEGETDALAAGEKLADEETVREREPEGEREAEADREPDNEALRLRLDDTLGEGLGVIDGDGRHWQQAFAVARQLSSLSAPVAKSPGDSTPRHVPAPVGAGWPTDGVPHRLALFAKKYAVDTPDAHVQLFTAARLVVGPAADDAPVQ